jgi:hypothetical protein
MRKAMCVAAGLALFAMAGAQAQGAGNPCPAGASPTDPALLTQDACQMGIDVFQVMAPQLGLALAGGNATLGQGGTLGGPGHFSIGVRGNVFRGDLPQVQDFPDPAITGRQQRTGSAALPSESQILGLPTADLALGVFRGVPLGLTNVGGIDLLVSATYVPTIGDAGEEIRVEPDRNLQLGYGVRIGLLQESLIVPGVSFTYLKRDLPKTTISGQASNFDLLISDAQVKTSAYRVVASKSLLVLGLAAGVGQDRYDQSAMVQATSGGVASAVVPLEQKLTRTNYFLDVSLNLPVIKFIGEVGRVTGGTVDTFNEFQTGRADKARTYGSVGIRIGI